MSEDSQTPERPTLLLLVRHGQTPTTGQVLPGRAPGLHLSGCRPSAGRSGGRALGGAAGHRGVLLAPERTLQTVGPTAERTGVPVVTEPGLTEGEFGDWTGQSLADLARLPQWHTVQHEPEAFRFPNGESFVEIRDRMAHTLERLRRAHPGGTIVCFSHADPIRVAVSDALGTPLNRFQRLSVGPCSVSAIAYRDGGGPGGADRELHAGLAGRAPGVG